VQRRWRCLDGAAVRGVTVFWRALHCSTGTHTGTVQTFSQSQPQGMCVRCRPCPSAVGEGRRTLARAPCPGCDWPTAPPSVERGQTVAEAGDSELSQRARSVARCRTSSLPAVPVPVPVSAAAARACPLASSPRLHSSPSRTLLFRTSGPLTTADTAGCTPSAVPEPPPTHSTPPAHSRLRRPPTATPTLCSPTPWTRPERTQSRPPTRTMSYIRARGAGRYVVGQQRVSAVANSSPDPRGRKGL
jgi:hypothetical protein